ncbi:MAG: sigma-54-dependent Fis family transcriptional regulator [Deltaproteobacteria bacterium]|nr:sigma-54-dependent Fis family transcriptional regulator [Deltaproteobacteria bacterium]
MRIDDLNIQELVEYDAESGTILFAGQRALIIDTTAIGSLRKDLIEHFGLATARGFLTRFGYIHGWRMAEAMQAHYKWDSDEDQRMAGGHIHMLAGMFRFDPDNADPLSKAGRTLLSSYEAEQHIAHLGRSESPVCWTICGLTSGYLSRTLGQDIYVLEERCIGRGDAACHLLGRTREEWGDDRAEELHFFRLENLNGWLDVSLHQITETLKEVEHKLQERTRVLARVASEVDEPLGMVSKSTAMRRLIDLAQRVAKVDTTLLITGESGTGKERIARFVHDQSARARGPFIAVNCGAITETLLESELFGHARGAFTGAVQNRPGLFEAANGGTLLLDEIGEVSPAMQIKLLRALQEREIRRVGENQSRAINVRVIAATNRELIEDIASGRFRKDLYYRLNVVELHMPALRDRRDDILPLARVLQAEAALRLKRPISSLSPRVADQLLRYDWPGNVRELENAMERAVALGRVKRTELDDLPEEVRQAIAIPAKSGEVKSLEDVEKEYILSVLDRNGGNQTRSAEQLGIGSATLYRKLKSYGAIGGKRGDRSDA